MKPEGLIWSSATRRITPSAKEGSVPNLERAVARHEVAVTLADIIEASEYLLRDGGRVAVVYPAGRYNEAISVMRKHNIGPHEG